VHIGPTAAGGRTCGLRLNGAAAAWAFISLGLEDRGQDELGAYGFWANFDSDHTKRAHSAAGGFALRCRTVALPGNCWQNIKYVA
jgi:hypothetical protein